MSGMLHGKVRHYSTRLFTEEWAASPEAISAYLMDATKARTEIDILVDRLNRFLARRETEKAAGLWPPASSEEGE